MATAHLVSVEEYMRSNFEPDAEYVEGRIVQRPMPQKPHSKAMAYFVRMIYEVGHPLGCEIWPEQRLRTKRNPDRYRVPDLCVTVGEPDEDVFTEPPFLCIEILSPDDSATELRTKIDEYLAMGVNYVWVVDPVTHAGEVHSKERIERTRDGVFRARDIEIDLKGLD
jgi:Uma2 family endonuclease